MDTTPTSTVFLVNLIFALASICLVLFIIKFAMDAVVEFKAEWQLQHELDKEKEKVKELEEKIAALESE